MTLANDSFLLTPSGSGVLLPTHLISAKEHPTQMLAGEVGHLYGSAPSYLAHFDVSNADAVAHDCFDFFNTTTSVVRIMGIWAISRQDVTVTFGTGGNLEKHLRVDYMKTTDVGTGGTALTYNGTTGATFVPKDSANATLAAGITGRVEPTAGATAGAFLFPAYLRVNTTALNTNMVQWLNLLPANERGEQEIQLNQNEGIKARQISDGSGMITNASAAAGFHHLVSFEVI